LELLSADPGLPRFATLRASGLATVCYRYRG